MLIRVFLDTEFTGFASPALLSIGLVADTTKTHELYAELDLESEVGRSRSKASSEFVHSAVLSQWGRVARAECNEHALGVRVGRWLLDLAAKPDLGASPTRLLISNDRKPAE